MNANCRKQVTRLMKALQARDNTGAYIRGASNPKSVMIDSGKSVLKYMAKDLELVEYKVTHNAGGVGVPGEVTLMGMWWDGKGIYVKISGFDAIYNGQFMYRTIKHMKDYSGGANRWTPVEQLNYDWDGVISKLDLTTG